MPKGNVKKNVSNQSSKPKQQPRRKRNQSALSTVQVTNAPVSQGISGRAKPGKFKPAKEGRAVLCHSELIGNVVGSDLFNATLTPINPGLQAFALWLSSMGPNYESYKFRKLTVRYENACSSATDGSVYVGVDFDPSDAAPQTEQQLTSYQDTQFTAPWKRVSYHCSPANLSKRKSYFVRTGTLAAGQDLGLYDTGNIIVATVGTPASTIGKLWVDYEVELMTPDYVITPAGRSFSGKISGVDNMATAPTVVGNLPLTSSVNGNVLTLTSTQSYAGLLGLNLSGTGLTVVAIGGTGAESMRQQNVNSAGTQITAVISLLFTAPGQTFTLSITTPTTVSGYACRIGQYDTVLNA